MVTTWRGQVNTSPAPYGSLAVLIEAQEGIRRNRQMMCDEKESR